MGSTAISMTTPREQALLDAFERGLGELATQFVEQIELDIALRWDSGESRQIGQISIPIKMRFQMRSLGMHIGHSGDVTRRALARKVSKRLSEKKGREVKVSCNWRYCLKAKVSDEQ
ncbi:MAG: hypothetical protein Q7T74_01200 [Candidatus Saccharibacteria bacterium]|nr:hypothetical protein [Candidatus Saccharibacteria bacterium]